MKRRTVRSILSENIKGNKLYILFMLIIGVCFYLMNVYTPPFCDDFHYCFIFGTATPISSIGDIFVSLHNHYATHNGRVVTHFFVQLFDGILGKAIFNVANTVVFVMFLHLLTTTATKDRSQYYRALTIALGGIFVVISYFFEMYLWLSGAFNYLWVATLLLFFNRQLQKDRKPAAWHYPLLVIAGLLCGWTHEGFVVPMSAAYFFYYLRCRPQITPYRIALLAGFVIGAVLTCTSPGTLYREFADTEFTLLSVIHACGATIYPLIYTRIFLALIAALIVLRIYSKKLFKTAIRSCSFWSLCTAAAFAFGILTMTGNYRKFLGLEVFSLIVLIRILLLIKIPKTICTCCNVAICVYAILAVAACKTSNDEYKQIEAQLQDKSTFIIESPGYSASRVFDKFIKREYGYGQTERFATDKWVISVIAGYYHRGEFVILPEEFVNDVKQHPEHYQNFYTLPNWSLYAKRINDDEKIKSVKYSFKKINREKTPHCLLPAASMIDEYAPTIAGELPTYTLTIGDDTYMIASVKDWVKPFLSGLEIEYE